MELREWQYINKPTVNSASPASSNISNKSFKKRFDKLIHFYGDHLPVEVNYISVNLITYDTLDFTENYSDGTKVRFNIFIDPTTEAWKIKYSVNGKLIDDISDTGWLELLDTLRVGYIDEVPSKGTPEYNRLLTEWVAMNNKTPSTGYKKRFEKLIKYHIDHASSELESVTHKEVKDDGFHLSEHYNVGASEFDRTIIVSVNKYTDEFFLSIFVDGKVVYRNEHEDYEKVLEVLTDTYMFLPIAGTQEYDDLLTESLNEWQLMNPPKASQSGSATSSKTNKEKFAELIAYMQKHKDSSTIFTSVNGPNDTGFEYEEQRASADGSEYNLSVEVSLSNHDLFTIHVDNDGKRVYNIMAKGWEELLEYLRIYFHAPNMGSPEYTSLTESFSSELKEWKPISTPSTLYKNKFKKLLDYHLSNDYHIKHGSSQGTVELLSEDNDKALFKYKETWEDGGSNKHETITGTAYFKKDASWWILKMVDGEQKESIDGNDFNELVKKLYRYFTLPPTNSSEYQALLEEVDSTIANDFKTYENLWD